VRRQDWKSGGRGPSGVQEQNLWLESGSEADDTYCENRQVEMTLHICGRITIAIL